MIFETKEKEPHTLLSTQNSKYLHLWRKIKVAHEPDGADYPTEFGKNRRKELSALFYHPP
jgi:hypothetical protein